MSLALAGRVFTTEPPGKPIDFFFFKKIDHLLKWALWKVTAIEALRATNTGTKTLQGEEGHPED